MSARVECVYAVRVIVGVCVDESGEISVCHAGSVGFLCAGLETYVSVVLQTDDKFEYLGADCIGKPSGSGIGCIRFVAYEIAECGIRCEIE